MHIRSERQQHVLEDDVIADFGKEWSEYRQGSEHSAELNAWFVKYFEQIDLNKINDWKVADFGAGSGRWAFFLSDHVEHIVCLEPSNAIEVAKRNLVNKSNVTFERSTIQNTSLADNTLDFGYSLGVLHHMVDTQEALKICVSKVKPGGKFLLYLYQDLSDRPLHYRALFGMVNMVRSVVCLLPFKAKKIVTSIIGLLIYYPLARLAKLLSRLGFSVNNLPLSSYKNSSLYTMQTDALDRFGTKLEKRYSKNEIQNLMRNAGLKNVVFNSSEPFWTALGTKD